MHYCRLLFVSVIVGLGGACAEEPRAVIPVSMSDSSGVQVVSIDGTPEVLRWDTVGDLPNAVEWRSNSGLELWGVGHVTEKDEGVVFANLGTREILSLDVVGDLVWRAGGRGEGPGELTRMLGLDVCESGVIQVVEPRRVHRFGATGSLTEVIDALWTPMSDPNSRMVGGMPDCSGIIVLARDRAVAEAHPNKPDIVRDRLHVVVVNFEDLTADTILTLPGHERYAGPKGSSAFPHAAQPLVVAAGGSVFIASGDSGEVREYDLHGRLLKVVRWPREGRVVDDDEWEATLELWNDGVRLPLPPPYRPTIAPTYKSLLVDDDCHCVALRVFALPELESFRLRGPEQWTLVDLQTGFMRELVLPEAATVDALGGSRLWVVWRDALDVESLLGLDVSNLLGS